MTPSIIEELYSVGQKRNNMLSNVRQNKIHKGGQLSEGHLDFENVSFSSQMKQKLHGKCFEAHLRDVHHMKMSKKADITVFMRVIIDDNDTELKFGDFSCLMDMFMCTKNEQLLRWWVTRLY